MIPRNLALERAILDAPDSEDAYLVLADWLQSQGEPLGELIVIQARKDKDEAREAELLAANKARWLGEELAALDGEGRLTLTWRCGFLETVVMARDLYEAFLACPIAQFVRSLEITIFDPATVADMARLGLPPLLKELRFRGRNPDGKENESELGALAPLYPRLGNLEELYLEARGFELGDIAIPNLKKLHAKSLSSLGRANLGAVIAANWPALETLTLGFGWHSQDCELEDLEPLLDGACIPKVDDLRFEMAPFADLLPEAISSSKICSRLLTLEISWAPLGRAGARHLLAEVNGAFGDLAFLTMLGTEVPTSLQEPLREAYGDRILLEDQFPSPADEAEDRARPPPEPPYVPPPGIVLPVSTTSHLAISPDRGSIAMQPTIVKPPAIDIYAKADGALEARFPIVGNISFWSSQLLWVSDAIIHAEYTDEDVPVNARRYWRIVRHRRSTHWTREVLAEIEGQCVMVTAVRDGFVVVGPGHFRRGAADGPLGAPIRNELAKPDGYHLLASDAESGRIVLTTDYGGKLFVLDSELCVVAERKTQTSGAWFCGPDTLITAHGRTLWSWRIEHGTLVEQGQTYLSEEDPYDDNGYGYPLGVTVIPGRRLFACARTRRTSLWFEVDTMKEVAGLFRGEDFPGWISPDERFIIVRRFQDFRIYDFERLLLPQ